LEVPAGSLFTSTTETRPMMWLVKYPGEPSVLMTDEEFVEFADRVKYDGVEYEAEPLR